VRPPFQRILDFGCGVGRTLIPFARHAGEVVGVDVSPTMLAEAARNCSTVPNVQLGSSLADVDAPFDLVHTYTVLQHIPVGRGMRLLDDLARLIAPGGVAAVHFTHARRAPLGRRLVHRARGTVPGVNAVVNLLQGRPPSEPMMQMNHYSIAAVSELLGGSVTAYETDHGGHLGVMLLARVPG
jgi:ubiquinone/menaquinone biosynthesis C-methylase UbiE